MLDKTRAPPNPPRTETTRLRYQHAARAKRPHATDTNPNHGNRHSGDLLRNTRNQLTRLQPLLGRIDEPCEELPLPTDVQLSKRAIGRQRAHANQQTPRVCTYIKYRPNPTNLARCWVARPPTHRQRSVARHSGRHMGLRCGAIASNRWYLRHTTINQKLPQTNLLCQNVALPTYVIQRFTGSWRVP